MFLKIKYLDPNFHDEQLIVTLNDFFTGGSGTMSKTLGFGLYYCLKNPEVMRTVQEEIDNMTGLRSPEDLFFTF